MALVTGHEPRASLHAQAGTLHWTAQRSASPCVWVPVPSQTTAAPQPLPGPLSARLASRRWVCPKCTLVPVHTGADVDACLLSINLP